MVSGDFNGRFQAFHFIGKGSHTFGYFVLLLKATKLKLGELHVDYIKAKTVLQILKISLGFKIFLYFVKMM